MDQIDRDMPERYAFFAGLPIRGARPKRKSGAVSSAALFDP